MKPKIFAILVMSATVALLGCHSRRPTPVVPLKYTLTAAERAELHLPNETDLTLATEADIKYVPKLRPEVTRTVAEFLKPGGHRGVITAARPVGKYLLLWVWFPKVKDGGIDLIYSVEKRRVVGTFCGGIRG